MLKRSVAISLVLLAGSAYLALASKTEPVPVRHSLDGFPAQIGLWRLSQNSPIAPRILTVLGVDDYLNCSYFRSGRSVVGLYIGYYGSQRQGDTIHSPLNCLPGAGWDPIRRTRVSVSATPAPIEVNLIVIRKGMDKQVVIYWYQSHGRVIASEYWGKIYTVLDAIRTNRTDAALVRIIAPVEGPDPAAERAAEENAIDFVRAVFPLLSSYLPD